MFVRTLSFAIVGLALCSFSYDALGQGKDKKKAKAAPKKDASPAAKKAAAPKKKA